MNPVAILILVVLLAARVPAAEWPWAIPTVAKNGRAFLWIPPDCDHVRGVVIGQQVILEAQVFEDPIIRAAAAREHLALVLLVPAAIGYDDFGPEGKGAGILQGILDQLAAVSGYGELAQAPFLTIGHSGGALFAWRAAYWKPERCFGVIGLKAAPIGPPAHAPKATLDGVPVLDISGQYESWGVAGQSAEHHWRWVRADLLAMRAKWPCALMSELVDPGVGHFGWHEELARYVAQFIASAAQRRIPAAPPAAGTAPVLQAVTLESGWLTDCTFMTPSRHPAATYAEYTGDPSMAMWHGDEALARANEGFGASRKGRQLQMVGFIQDGKVLTPAWIQELKPTFLEDGRTVRVAADFVSETPAELSFPAKRALGHGDGPIRFRLIGGWRGGGEQTGSDTFRYRFDRFGIWSPSEALMIMACHDGDRTYAYHEQPCGIKFPVRNTKGTAQTITATPIPDQPDAVAGTVIPLAATSDAGLPVEWCVVAGPVELRGRELVVTALPPRTKRPVTVTVVAWQWGRSLEPLVQSAKHVEMTFQMGRP